MCYTTQTHRRARPSRVCRLIASSSGLILALVTPQAIACNRAAASVRASPGRYRSRSRSSFFDTQTSFPAARFSDAGHIGEPTPPPVVGHPVHGHPRLGVARSPTPRSSPVVVQSTSDPPETSASSSQQSHSSPHAVPSPLPQQHEDSARSRWRAEAVGTVHTPPTPRRPPGAPSAVSIISKIAHARLKHNYRAPSTTQAQPSLPGLMRRLSYPLANAPRPLWLHPGRL